MGGYADYVWPAFIIALGLLSVTILIASLRLRKIIKALQRNHAEAP